VVSERKQVTVLFADVKGSMDLSGSLDVEQWWTIMQRFFSLLGAGVHRFGGKVDRFTGDGAMAVFGAPSALEDHARRACHAALWLQERLAHYANEVHRERGLSFAVRIGLNSGEVVVGRIGDESSTQYTVVGHPAGLAQRMESLAEPGGVCLTESTAKLVRGFFILHELGSMDVKGVNEPLRVFALGEDQEPRTAFEMSVARGLSRFVGRDEELATLDSALRRALAGDGQVLAVVADAGLGKTRLCHEFVERCHVEGIGVSEAHARAHMRAVPFLPVLELLRDSFDIGESDDDRTAREKVATRLRELGEESKDSLRLLLDFMSIPDPESPPSFLAPEARQRQMFAALNRLVTARSNLEPGVFLIEDLHWIDFGSAAFLENMIEGLAGTRTLLLTTFRPEYQADWLDRPYCSELRLPLLGDAASESLLRDLLGGDPSLDGIGPLVFEHADGNPFFIEEIIKALAENGTLLGVRGAYRLTRTLDEVEIPQTVQSVLAARIDRLGEREKALLRTAAVIGREFSEPVVRRVSGLGQEDLTAALAGLLGSELIFQAPDDDKYIFKHALAERVAYRSQLEHLRAGTHAAVAEAIAEEYPERLDELAALIAHHWERAGDLMSAAKWRARGAVRTGFNDPKEALRQWQKARELADAAEESPERAELALGARVMLLNLAWRQGVPEDQPRSEFEAERASLYQEARALAKSVDNLHAETVIVAAYGAMRGLAGHLEDMADLGMQALELADAASDHALKLSVLPSSVYGLYALGRFVEVLELLQGMSAEFPENPAEVVGVSLVCPYAWVLCWKAAARAHAGALPEAFSGFEQALALARERGDHETESWVHMSTVQAMQLAGGGNVLVHAREAQEIAERAGGAFSVGLAWRYLAIAHVVREEWAEAIRAIELALAIWRPRRVGLEAEPHALTMLARAQLGVGDPEKASITAQEAVTLAVGRRTRCHEIEARLALAQALRASSGAGAAAAVESHLRQVRSLVKATGARSLEPRLHGELAELARLRGDEATCARERERARRQFIEVGAPILAEGVAVTIG
jgi:adenylate cyclase